MSRRWYFIVVALLAGSAALWLAWPASEPAPGRAEPSSERRAGSRRSGSSPAPAQVEESPALTAASVAGRVVRAGVPVTGAVVSLRSEDADLETRTGEGGLFAFERVSPGRLLVAAFTQGEASEVVGPFVVTPGQRVEGLVLDLHAAAFVSGAVYDLRSGAPLAGASVRSSSGEVLTGADGRFRLGPIPATGTWLQARATGYEQRLQWLTVDGARERSGLDFYLRATVSVSGRVLRQGQPVPGATVWAETATLTSQPDRFGPAITDGEGAFELGVAPGDLQFAAAAPGGGRVGGPKLVVAEGGKYEDLVIELGQSLTAEGVVTVDGQPAPGAAVLLIDARVEAAVASSVTDAGGGFVVGGLAPGRYLVQVTRGALVAQRGPFELTGDADAPWAVDVVGRGAVFGRVEPPAGGVVVRLRASHWAGGAGPENVTGPDGRFSFESAPEGEWSVEAETDSAWASARGVAGEELVLRLERASLRGAARDERGQPVTDFVVHAMPATGGPARVQAVLDPNGSFTLPVPPGRYDVFARSPVHGESAFASAEVGAGREATVELRFGGSVSLSARVVDHQTRAPLSGVEVSIVRWNSRAGLVGRTAGAMLTDAEGRFELTSGTASAALRLRKDGYRTVHVRVPASTAQLPPGGLEYAMAPGPSDSRPPVEPYEGVGMQLRPADPSGGPVVIEAVFDGSPAHEAGVVRGDQLLAVDGASVAGLPLPEVIRRIMGPAGTIVRLKLRRGDAEFERALRRRSIQL